MPTIRIPTTQVPQNVPGVAPVRNAGDAEMARAGVGDAAAQGLMGLVGDIMAPLKREAEEKRQDEKFERRRAERKAESEAEQAAKKKLRDQESARLSLFRGKVEELSLQSLNEESTALNQSDLVTVDEEAYLQAAQDRFTQRFDDLVATFPQDSERLQQIGPALIQSQRNSYLRLFQGEQLEAFRDAQEKDLERIVESAKDLGALDQALSGYDEDERLSYFNKEDREGVKWGMIFNHLSERLGTGDTDLAQQVVVAGETVTFTGALGAQGESTLPDPLKNMPAPMREKLMRESKAMVVDGFRSQMTSISAAVNTADQSAAPLTLGDIEGLRKSNDEVASSLDSPLGRKAFTPDERRLFRSSAEHQSMILDGRAQRYQLGDDMALGKRRPDVTDKVDRKLFAEGLERHRVRETLKILDPESVPDDEMTTANAYQKVLEDSQRGGGVGDYWGGVIERMIAPGSSGAEIARGVRLGRYLYDQDPRLLQSMSEDTRNRILDISERANQAGGSYQQAVQLVETEDRSKESVQAFERAISFGRSPGQPNMEEEAIMEHFGSLDLPPSLLLEVARRGRDLARSQDMAPSAAVKSAILSADILWEQDAATGAWVHLPPNKMYGFDARADLDRGFKARTGKDPSEVRQDVLWRAVPNPDGQGLSKPAYQAVLYDRESGVFQPALGKDGDEIVMVPTRTAEVKEKTGLATHAGNLQTAVSRLELDPAAPMFSLTVDQRRSARNEMVRRLLNGGIGDGPLSLIQRFEKSPQHADRYWKKMREEYQRVREYRDQMEKALREGKTSFNPTGTFTGQQHASHRRLLGINEALELLEGLDMSLED